MLRRSLQVSHGAVYNPHAMQTALRTPGSPSLEARSGLWQVLSIPAPYKVLAVGIVEDHASRVNISAPPRKRPLFDTPATINRVPKSIKRLDFLPPSSLSTLQKRTLIVGSLSAIAKVYNMLATIPYRHRTYSKVESVNRFVQKYWTSRVHVRA